VPRGRARNAGSAAFNNAFAVLGVLVLLSGPRKVLAGRRFSNELARLS
jgi:hypothetical protein